MRLMLLLLFKRLAGTLMEGISHSFLHMKILKVKPSCIFALFVLGHSRIKGEVNLCSIIALMNL